MSFSDATLSRRHFEVFFDDATDLLHLRALGTAGGPFVRIPFGRPKKLTAGMMIMLGEHQLKASAPGGEDGGGEPEGESSSDHEDEAKALALASTRTDETGDIVSAADEILSDDGDGVDDDVAPGRGRQPARRAGDRRRRQDGEGGEEHS